MLAEVWEVTEDVVAEEGVVIVLTVFPVVDVRFSIVEVETEMEDGLAVVTFIVLVVEKILEVLEKVVGNVLISELVMKDVEVVAVLVERPDELFPTEEFVVVDEG